MEDFHQFEKDTEEALVRGRKAWLECLQELSEWPGVVELPKYPLLDERHLRNCRVLPNRLHLLDQMPTGCRVAEIGVLNGGFSKQILNRCRPSRLHLIDLKLRQRLRSKFKKKISEGIVHLHEGDSSTLLEEFEDGYFDFIYIDGDHSYEGVMRDIRVSTRKVKRDGYLLFNDYTYWSPLECMPYGVHQAVNELCINEGWEVLYFALAHFMYCDVAIRRTSPGEQN